MIKVIKTNATNARKNLFLLIDQVVNEGVKVILTKEGLKEQVVLQRMDDNYDYSDQTKQLNVVRDTAGSIKTKGYDPDEKEMSKKALVKSYLEKYDLK